MTLSFISAVLAPDFINEPAYWFIFYEENILLQNVQIPCCTKIADLNMKEGIYMGTYHGRHCFAISLDQRPLTIPANMNFQTVRESHELLNDEALFGLVSRAKQLLHWDKSTQFCGYCGGINCHSDTLRAKKCVSCSALVFPQIAPVMLALVWRNDEILLARSPSFMPGIYSILAGFVEPGEMLEHTVVREVREETGVNVKNLQYFSSQPWPFQSNLMLGFIAEYESGTLQADLNELEDAQWFSIYNLPKLPKPISLSRQMIDAWVAKRAASRI